MDNSRMHPSTGVIKLWEKEPDTVEHLFLDILFADADKNVPTVQIPQVIHKNIARDSNQIGRISCFLYL